MQIELSRKGVASKVPTEVFQYRWISEVWGARTISVQPRVASGGVATLAAAGGLGYRD